MKWQFNLLSNEKTINCNIRVVDWETTQAINIRTKYLENPTIPDPDDAIGYIEEYLDSICYSSDMDKIKSLLSFIEGNKEELLKGSVEQRILKIDSEIQKLNTEKEKLINNL